MADVLVIDDDPDIRSLMEVALGLDRHDVTTAPSGRAGVQALAAAVAEGRSPVVILDIQMPDIDGWQVLDEVRGNPDLEATPVILCTVKASPEDIHRGWLAGCDGYLTKPFDLRSVNAEVLRLAAVAPPELVKIRNDRRAQLPSG